MEKVSGTYSGRPRHLKSLRWNQSKSCGFLEVAKFISVTNRTHISLWPEEERGGRGKS